MIQILKYIFSHPITSKQKIKAFFRFIKWQLASRILPYPIVFPFVGNTKLLVKKGMTGATGNIYAGLHEFKDMGFTLHFLRKEDFFVDIGGNVGSYTILAAGAIGASTLAIEPIPSTFGYLKDNIAINHVGEKVIPLNIGVGANESVLEFTSTLDTVNHILSEKEKQNQNIARIEVKVKRLDDLLQEKTPILIKIDVEGVELEVLNGGNNTFSNPLLKAIIIELNGTGKRYGYEDNTVHEKLLAWGYAPYTYDPYLRKLEPLDTYGNFNTIYLKDLDFIKERVTSAMKFQVLDQSI